MKEARIYVDFNEMIEDDVVPLSQSDYVKDSAGSVIELKEGLKVKLYSNDLAGCHQEDNLIADGLVELNTNIALASEVKWNCRLNKAGIYNESQRSYMRKKREIRKNNDF